MRSHCFFKNTTKSLAALGITVFVLLLAAGNVSAWTMKKAPLMTQWSMVNDVPQISADHVWEKYPRMQMRRPADSWQNLNGVWRFQTLSSQTAPIPSGMLTGDILVPFPPQSAISGVMTSSSSNTNCVYRRLLNIPSNWSGKKVLVHFEAVDYRAQVYLNSLVVGQHDGGYDRFTINLSRHNVKTGDTLTVRVWDPTNTNGSYNPIGKQTTTPGSIWYTGTTGIWKNVWLEAVPASIYVKGLKITPDVDNSRLRLSVILDGDNVGQLSGVKVYAFAKNKDRGMWGVDSLNAAATTNLTIPLSAVNLWWPDRPFLYDLGVYIKKDGAFLDSVQSYFGMRKVSWKAISSRRIPHINDQPLYMFGTLDQGFWPDGIYTPPSEAAMLYDLKTHKDVGMNGLRKHVKIETDYWFWLCDSLGMLIQQDMPSISGSPTTEGRANFARELDSLILNYYNHPCIYVWIPFNEGWGIYGADAAARLAYVTEKVNRIKALDSTRIVNAHSGVGFGWYPIGDVRDDHNYPAPNTPNANSSYILQLGEYGGIRLNTTAMDAHEWSPNNSWGYADQTSQANYESQFRTWCQTLANNKNYTTGPGVYSAIYTQITDVETECNGLMTYDRAVLKGRADQMKASADLIVDHPTVAAIVNPTAQIPASFYDVTDIANARPKLRMDRIVSDKNGIIVSFYGTPDKSQISLRLVNARGQNVFQTMAKGSSTLHIATNSFAKGVYYMVLNNGTTSQYLRCVVR